MPGEGGFRIVKNREQLCLKPEPFTCRSAMDDADDGVVLSWCHVKQYYKFLVKVYQKVHSYLKYIYLYFVHTHTQLIALQYILTNLIAEL